MKSTGHLINYSVREPAYEALQSIFLQMNILCLNITVDCIIGQRSYIKVYDTNYFPPIRFW